jgi:sugar fermentation stimulation protein A
LAEGDGTFVGIKTFHPNHLVEEAIHSGIIAELQGYHTLKREVRYGKNSRIDVLLSDPLTYVEVKNVHLKRGQTAGFPSSVTARGAKHMRELSEMVRQGHQSYVIYVVQRNDCKHFEIASDIDPVYGKEMQLALEAKVKVLVYACEVNPKGITITHRIGFNDG